MMVAASPAAVARARGRQGHLRRGALPGETVVAEQTARSRHFDEARTLEVLQPRRSG
jgi:23S rRNA (uracil1939-C5)-methyltransferase